MHVISEKALRSFWMKHPRAEISLKAWAVTMGRNVFTDFNDLKETFGSADYVAPYTVFNVGGNNFRLIAVVHYSVRKVYVRHVFTHAEYDRWTKLYEKDEL